MALEFESIAPRSLPDLVAERIAKAIQEGRFAPGDQLPTEQVLVSQLGVGRTSVREGLQKLQALGLVETHKGRGTFVADAERNDGQDFAQWSAKHRFAIGEMLEIRLALESAAAGIAAQRANAMDLVAIERCQAQHAEAGVAGSLEEIVRTDDQFHLAIAAAAKNRALYRMLEGVSAEATEFRRRTHALTGGPQRSAEGHQAVLDAIRQRAPGDARAAMVAHLWPLYEGVEQAAADAGSPGPTDTPLVGLDAFR